MPEFWEKQAQIERLRHAALESYPQLWAGMIADWQSSSGGDAAWLMYSANYLFRTNGIRWAIDPFSLHWRLPAAPEMNLSHDLDGLEFVLLTHAHKDHLDLDLVSALKDLPVTWVVPEFLAPVVQKHAGLKPAQMAVPRLLEPVRLSGITITPFAGQHLVPNPGGTPRGLPELGYLVEYASRRLLFPGDVRIYDAASFPNFESVDILFAHLWLGRGLALKDQPELRQAFCQFCADFHPGRVVITHLHEFGRDANDFLDEEHITRVVQIFRVDYPHLKTSPAYMGERIDLDI